MAVKQWEYMVVWLNRDDLPQRLNTLGLASWELVTVSRIYEDPILLCVLKKEKT